MRENTIPSYIVLDVFLIELVACVSDLAYDESCIIIIHVHNIIQYNSSSSTA